MDFHLHIEMGYRQMKTREHVADALESAAAKIRNGAGESSIMDANGNTVGSFKFEGNTVEWEIILTAHGLSDDGADDLDDALDIICGHGVADDQAGETDSGALGHTFRVGKYTRHTNSDGVKTTTEHDTEADAEEHMDELHAQLALDEDAEEIR